MGNVKKTLKDKLYLSSFSSLKFSVVIKSEWKQEGNLIISRERDIKEDSQ